jgi:hypothetical protein
MSSFWSASSVNPALAWSLGNGGKGRYPLKFPLDLGWYYEQPCTRFQTLQHRKYRVGFEHEFIVLKLSDGSICRLERMGDPNARFDALSAQGSVAHDVAQCFPPDKHSEACLDVSDVVAEVTFLRRLDLLDVLRVCRAIHEGERTCNYTLQSFNCYFFALAIQSVLTRLVAGWKGVFLAEKCLRSTQCALSDMPKMLQSTEDEKPLLARIYSLLQPQIQWPAEDLVDGLKEELLNQDLFLQIDRALSSVLWHSNLGLIIDDLLENRVRDVMVRVLHGGEHDPTSQDSQPPNISNVLSKPTKEECKSLLNLLISRAASTHEQESRGLKLNRLQRYAGIFRAFELLWSGSSSRLSKLSDLDFRPTNKSTPPLNAPQPNTSLSAGSQKFTVWLIYTKSAVVWLLCLILRLLWIAPMGFVESHRHLVFEDIITPTLSELEDLDYRTTDISQIVQHLRTLCITTEPVQWRVWPWAHMHKFIKQRVLDSILDEEKSSLRVQLQVSSSILCL